MTIEDLSVGYLEAHTLSVFHRFQPCYPDPCHPVTFSVAAAPMPSDCEFSFFDPNDASCQDILFDPDTSVSELFAILRQWVPQVQQNIDVIGNEILKRGCNVNDRDGLTDMTLLHYTCKSGAQGIGDAETAAKFASYLIDVGADVSLRSRWTNMNALHYAAYFDVPELIHLILKASKPRDVDATCSDFDFGTALHIAASNLCLGAVKALLEYRANPAFRDDRGRVPADVVPDPVDMPLEMADAAAVAKEIKQILLDAMPLLCDLSQIPLPNYDNVPGNVSLQSSGLKLGERVLIAGQKYFLFFWLLKTFIRSSANKSTGPIKSTKIDLSHVTSKINTGRPPFKKNATFIQSNDESVNSASSKKGHRNTVSSPMGSPTSEQTDFQPGDRVLVVGQRLGTVRFYGKTNFAPGYWCGIELDKPHGKNDGSISRVQYFTCPPKHGVFAPPSRVQRVSGSLDSLSEIPASKLNHSFPGFKRSLSSTSTAASQKGVNRRHSYGRPRKPSLRRSWSSASSAGASDGGVKLHKGSQVLLTSSNEIAAIRYIGPTDFAPGVWLGLELRSAKGKNDGCVGEKRYFHCKPNHGILVRPGRVTYRGINGSKLVDEIC